MSFSMPLFQFSGVCNPIQVFCSHVCLYCYFPMYSRPFHIQKCTSLLCASSNPPPLHKLFVCYVLFTSIYEHPYVQPLLPLPFFNIVHQIPCTPILCSTSCTPELYPRSWPYGYPKVPKTAINGETPIYHLLFIHRWKLYNIRPLSTFSIHQQLYTRTLVFPHEPSFTLYTLRYLWSTGVAAYRMVYKDLRMNT